MSITFEFSKGRNGFNTLENWEVVGLPIDSMTRYEHVQDAANAAFTHLDERTMQLNDGTSGGYFIEEIKYLPEYNDQGYWTDSEGNVYMGFDDGTYIQILFPEKFNRFSDNPISMYRRSNFIPLRLLSIATGIDEAFLWELEHGNERHTISMLEQMKIVDIIKICSVLETTASALYSFDWGYLEYAHSIVEQYERIN